MVIAVVTRGMQLATRASYVKCERSSASDFRRLHVTPTSIYARLRGLLRLLHHHDVAHAHLLNRERDETDRDLVADLDDHDLSERARREVAVVLADGVARHRRLRIAAPDHEHAIADLHTRALAEIEEHDLALPDQLIFRQHRDDRALRVDLRRHRRHVRELLDERADLRASFDLVVRLADHAARFLVLLDADD